MTEFIDKIPTLIFIVPYRNRPQHKYFFSNYLKTIMEGRDDYEVYFSHQCDARAFNRGATKNIGFLAVKRKYPEHYKNMTFVFNDIDTLPFANVFHYDTIPGIVKHFYGFTYALGGIVAFNGLDFEKTNGFPNFWGWGMEDNVLQKRCENIGLTIDRSQFYQIGSPNILHLFDGIKRIINRKDPWRATNDNGIDGIKTIHRLQYSIDTESKNTLDNVHIIADSRFLIINIDTFMTGIKFEQDNYIKYDLREPARKIIHPSKIKTQKVDHMVNDWSNIPYYPSSEKHVTINESINDYNDYNDYNNDNNDNTNQTQQQLQLTSKQAQEIILNRIKKYNEILKYQNSNKQIVSPNVNKFSPVYSKVIGQKPKASKSANIRLGGVY